MKRDKNQQIRFNKAELQFLKSLFADNEELLFAIRKVMLQLPTTPHENGMILGLNDEAHEILKKFFLPDLDGDSPIFQMTDMKLALGGDTKNLTPEGAWLYFKAKELEINYLEQQLEVLKDRNTKETISLEEMGSLKGGKPDADDMFINILARNYLLSFVDSNLNQIKILAGLPTETVDDTLKRLQQDSNK